jgi:hypothetical protein
MGKGCNRGKSKIGSVKFFQDPLFQFLFTIFATVANVLQMRQPLEIKNWQNTDPSCYCMFPQCQGKNGSHLSEIGNIR